MSQNPPENVPEVASHALFSDFAAAFDGLSRIAYNQRETVIGAIAEKYLAPLKDRWEWIPGESPYVRAKSHSENS
jgi:hypothetical protein